MKLRNKDTGEIFDALIREKGGGGAYSLIVCDIKAYEQSKSTLDETHFILDEYDTLADLNENWEDYTPKAPLIADEKILKAVRAWAKSLRTFPVKVRYNEGMFSFCTDLSGIEFDREIEGIETGDYTIEELCGEEEK